MLSKKMRIEFCIVSRAGALHIFLCISLTFLPWGNQVSNEFVFNVDASNQHVPKMCVDPSGAVMHGKGIMMLLDAVSGFLVDSLLLNRSKRWDASSDPSIDHLMEFVKLIHQHVCWWGANKRTRDQTHLRDLSSKATEFVKLTHMWVHKANLMMQKTREEEIVGQLSLLVFFVFRLPLLPSLLFEDLERLSVHSSSRWCSSEQNASPLV